MPFRIVPEKRLQVEADRVEAQILMPQYRAETWTMESLRGRLEAAGMEYSVEEIEAIIAELVARQVLAEERSETPAAG